MKKKILTLLFVIIAFTAFSQYNYVTISGTVTYASNAGPVSNCEVHIYSDSSQSPSMFPFYSTVQTNPNGFYVDTISIEYGGVIYTQGTFMVYVIDCNGAVNSLSVTYAQSNTGMQANFTVCDSLPVNNCSPYFTYSASSSPFSYAFTNASSGVNNQTQFYWDFDDGATSTLANPVHTFSAPGYYNVCLHMYDSTCQNVYCSNIAVAVDSMNGCPASFYVYQDSTYANTYYFYNTSPGVNNGVISNFLWSFGDGTGSSDINPSHTFTGFGTYNVCLSVIDSTGVTLCNYCTTIAVDSFNIQACYAYFGWNYTSAGSVNFYDYSSAGVPADAITSWVWSFGDGTSSTDQNPIHFFGNGLYNVCLIINTSSGCTSTYCDYVQTGNIDSSNCYLYVYAETIQNESTSGAADGAIDISVYSGTSPYAYLWNTGASTEDISGLTAGYYDVMVTDVNGCQTWATFEVINASDSSNWVYVDTLNSAPIDSCFNFSIGNANIYSFTFIDNTTIEVTWIVYDTQGISHGFVTTTYSFDASAGYILSVVINCSSEKSVHIFFDELYIMSSTGIDPFIVSEENVVVYPNPVIDVLYIAMPTSLNTTTVNIVNASGQLVRSMSATSENNISINTASLEKGVYFIQVNNNGKMYSGRFIK